MSHIVTIAAKVKDQVAVSAACRRLGLTKPVYGTAKLFSGEATGLIVQLPGWEYPAVIDTQSGSIKYDIYSGAWGDQGHLDKFLQCYAVEKARLEATRRGHQVSEQLLSDGSIKLTIQTGCPRSPTRGAP